MPSELTATTAPIDPRGASRSVAFAMRDLEQRFDAVTANLANAETVGHKRLVSRPESFASYLARARSPDGAALRPVQRDFTQGELTVTDDPADVALNGPGFFAVEKNGEVEYTRTLHVHADTDGTLLDEHGARVLGEGGPLRLSGPLASYQFENDGALKSDGSDAGRLRVVNFVDPQRLDDRPGGYFHAADRLELTGATGTQVRQRERENSNVSAIDEMVELITIQRHFETAQRALSVEADLREKLNQGLR